MLLSSVLASLAFALSPTRPPLPWREVQPAHRVVRTASIRLEVASPFADGNSGAAAAEETSSSSSSSSGPLELTMENVDMVLDEMRPYLMADGGNVAIREIDGGVVRLELQGACGTCPSSMMTMKMGLEKGLREKIPEIIAVEQVEADGPELTEEGIEAILEEIRPFLKMTGGDCQLVDLDTAGVGPSAMLSITGQSATINSVRTEISQRLKRNVRRQPLPPSPRPFFLFAEWPPAKLTHFFLSRAPFLSHCSSRHWRRSTSNE